MKTNFEIVPLWNYFEIGKKSKISANTIDKFIGYFEDSFMLKRVYRYDVKGEGLNGIGRPRNQGILSMTPETGTSPEFFFNRLIFVQNNANLDESRHEWTEKWFRGR